MMQLVDRKLFPKRELHRGDRSGRSCSDRPAMPVPAQVAPGSEGGIRTFINTIGVALPMSDKRGCAGYACG